MRGELPDDGAREASRPGGGVEGEDGRVCADVHDAVVRERGRGDDGLLGVELPPPSEMELGPDERPLVCAVDGADGVELSVIPGAEATSNDSIWLYVHNYVISLW